MLNVHEMKLNKEVFEYLALWQHARARFIEFYPVNLHSKDIKARVQLVDALLDPKASKVQRLAPSIDLDGEAWMASVFTESNAFVSRMQFYYNSDLKSAKQAVVSGFVWMHLCAKELDVLYMAKMAQIWMKEKESDTSFSTTYERVLCDPLVKKITKIVRTAHNQLAFLHINFDHYVNQLLEMHFPKMSFDSYNFETMQGDFESFLDSHADDIQDLLKTLSEYQDDLTAMSESFSVAQSSAPSTTCEEMVRRKSEFSSSMQVLGQMFSRRSTENMGRKVETYAGKSADYVGTEPEGFTAQHFRKTQSLAMTKKESTNPSEEEVREPHWQPLYSEHSEASSAGWEDFRNTLSNMEVVDLTPESSQISFSASDYPSVDSPEGGSGFQMGLGKSLRKAMDLVKSAEKGKQKSNTTLTLKQMKKSKIQLDMLESCPDRFFATMQTLVDIVSKNQSFITQETSAISEKVRNHIMGYMHLFASWRQDCDRFQKNCLQAGNVKGLYQVYIVLSKQHQAQLSSLCPVKCIQRLMLYRMKECSKEVKQCALEILHKPHLWPNSLLEMTHLRQVQCSYTEKTRRHRQGGLFFGGSLLASQTYLLVSKVVSLGLVHGMVTGALALPLVMWCMALGGFLGMVYFFKMLETKAMDHAVSGLKIEPRAFESGDVALGNVEGERVEDLHREYTVPLDRQSIDQASSGSGIFNNFDQDRLRRSDVF